MNHKIYGKPNHKLDTVSIKLWLPTAASNWQSKLLVMGDTYTQRSSLWSHCEMWSDPLEVTGMTMTDAVHHIALIAVQDRPTTQEMFDFHLHGGAQYGEQQELF